MSKKKIKKQNKKKIYKEKYNVRISQSQGINYPSTS